MKFINYLTSITGVEIYPLISLLVFFLFFVVLFFFVWKADKVWVETLSKLPVEDNELKHLKDNHLKK